MSVIFGWFFMFFIISITAGLIALQVYLSKRKSPYPGLVLPVLLIILILLPAIFSATRYIKNDTESSVAESQTEVSEGIWPIDWENRTRGGSSTEDMSIMVFPFFVFIFDIALFIIYFVIRRNIAPDKKTELKRMAVQDL